MARCAHCGAETDLYVSGVPLCPSCESRPKSEAELIREVEDARRDYRAASNAQQEAHPDRDGRRREAAYIRYREALGRLSEFMSRRRGTDATSIRKRT